MADEQTPQSDLIDDAIRQAERQLEARLDALRASALGDGRDDGGRASRAYEADDPRGEPVELRHSPRRPSPSVTLEEDGEDLEEPRRWESIDTRRDVEPAGGVSGLQASWDDQGADTPRTGGADREWERPEPVHASWTGPSETGAVEAEAWDARERHERPEPRLAPPVAAASVPSEEELQFWAQTRTALRNLQQQTEGLAGQVLSPVVDEVERIVRDELGASTATLRVVQQGLQQGLPKLAERIEQSMQEELEGPTAAIRQVQEELPLQLDRMGRELRTELSGEIAGIGRSLQTGVHEDIGQLEQSIATNVTRMAQGLDENLSRVERGMGSVDEQVARGVRTLRSDAERTEQAVGSALERLEGTLRDELSMAIETTRKLDEELPARFDRIERTIAGELRAESQAVRDELRTQRQEGADDDRALQDELVASLRADQETMLEELRRTQRTLGERLHSGQRDLADVVAGLAEADTAVLEQLGTMGRVIEDERTGRAQDLEFLVDTMTTGWQGLASALTTLHEHSARTLDRLDELEQRFSSLGSMERSVEQSMRRLEGHLMELQPAPVIVTVNHPDAHVQNTTKGGWLVEQQETSPSGSN